MKCTGCDRFIRPQKKPYPSQTAFAIGGLSVLVPGNICLYIYHTDFITAGLVAMPFAVIVFILSIYLWYKRMYFE